MPSISETLGAGNSQMQAALDAGVEQLSQNQTVVFTRYQKFVFSEDGSVFWVATATTLTAAGSLHIITDRVQEEDQTIATDRAVFTSEIEVTAFNAVAPNTMWIGTWALPEATLQVAFSSRGSFYAEANLWHYAGFCVYPALSAQLVTEASDLPQGPIVSNSLPIWLSLNAMAPVYPSFLVPDNLVPPYIVAHVEPANTTALAAFPLLSWPGVIEPDTGASPFHELPSYQLTRDEVDLTLYGFTNQMAIQYYWSLIDASLNLETFGFANSPIIQDEKRHQVELAALAQKKLIHISANYYQSTASAIAYRLILEAFVSEIFVQGGVSPVGQGTIAQDAQTASGSGTVTYA